MRVHAAAVNPLDYQIRRGDYADHVPLPAIIGHDNSGVIKEVGPRVTEFAVGDAVYYTPRIFGGPGSDAAQHVADVDLVDRHHGGAGGVGTIAIQVAKAIGARVITTAKGDDHEFVRSLGADAAIDFTSTDYVDAVAEMTRGKGVHVVFDTIGGDTLTRSPLRSSASDASSASSTSRSRRTSLRRREAGHRRDSSARANGRGS